MVGRTTAAIVGVVALVALAAGAFAFTGFLGGGASAVDQVPGGVDAVVHVDGDVMTDDATRTILETRAGDGSQSLADALTEFEDETGLDPQGFEQAVGFGQIPDRGFMMSSQETYGGYIFHASWEQDDVVEVMRNESRVELEAGTYNGQPIYRPAEEPAFGTAISFGVLGDGQFVAGTEAAVEDAIDVSGGDAQSLSGDLRAAFENTPDGLARFAVRVPSDQIPAQGTGGMGPDVSQFQSVDVVAGSYYTGSNNAGVEFHLITGSQSDAQDVQDVVEGGISMLSGFSQEGPAQEHLRAIEVERSGSTVVVGYERSVDSIQGLLEYYQTRGTGSAGA